MKRGGIFESGGKLRQNYGVLERGGIQIRDRWPVENINFEDLKDLRIGVRVAAIPQEGHYVQVALHVDGILAPLEVSHGVIDAHSASQLEATFRNV